MRATVTMRDLLGCKSHSCPAPLGVAVGETWVASKPGGLNVRNSDDLETPAAWPWRNGINSLPRQSSAIRPREWCPRISTSFEKSYLRLVRRRRASERVKLPEQDFCPGTAG